MAKGVKNQMGAGRPKTAVDKANLPEKITSPSVGELPKKVQGSHMGMMITGAMERPPTLKGPALPTKPKSPAKIRKAPPL